MTDGRDQTKRCNQEAPVPAQPANMLLMPARGTGAPWEPPIIKDYRISLVVFDYGQVYILPKPSFVISIVLPSRRLIERTVFPVEISTMS